jgi:hypothetical protein
MTGTNIQSNYMKHVGGVLWIGLTGYQTGLLLPNAAMMEKNYPGIHEKLLLEEPLELGKKYIEGHYKGVPTEMLNKTVILDGMMWGYSALLASFQEKCIKDYFDKVSPGKTYWIDEMAKTAGIPVPEKIENLTGKPELDDIVIGLVDKGIVLCKLHL